MKFSRKIALIFKDYRKLKLEINTNHIFGIRQLLQKERKRQKYTWQNENFLKCLQGFETRSLATFFDSSFY